MYDDKVYCKENGISVTIPPHLEDDEFLAARENAFLNACRVWNAVDQSGRRRIMMPERPLKVQMVPVPQSKAMNHAESDRESEASSCPHDEDSE